MGSDTESTLSNTQIERENQGGLSDTRSALSDTREKEQTGEASKCQRRHPDLEQQVISPADGSQTQCPAADQDEGAPSPLDQQIIDTKAVRVVEAGRASTELYASPMGNEEGNNYLGASDSQSNDEEDDAFDDVFEDAEDFDGFKDAWDSARNAMKRVVSNVGGRKDEQ